MNETTNKNTDILEYFNIHNNTADDAKRRVSLARVSSLAEAKREYLLALRDELYDWLEYVERAVADTE